MGATNTTPAGAPPKLSIPIGLIIGFIAMAAVMLAPIDGYALKGFEQFA